MEVRLTIGLPEGCAKVCIWDSPPRPALSLLVSIGSTESSLLILLTSIEVSFDVALGISSAKKSVFIFSSPFPWSMGQVPLENANTHLCCLCLKDKLHYAWGWGFFANNVEHHPFPSHLPPSFSFSVDWLIVVCDFQSVISVLLRISV